MKRYLLPLLTFALLHNQLYAKDLTVAQDGTGDTKTIQAAIDAVPADNASPITIHIKPGTYKEKLVIPKDKPFISLKGDDAATTILTNDWNSHHPGDNGREVGTFGSYSTSVAAPNFTAENLTFENTAGDTGQALALAAVGDRQIYKNCRLLGWQDTLYCNSGRQFYDHCYIEGRVDFIFGNAVAVFDHCTIHSKNGGHVTAASTAQTDPWGLVFLDCKLTGSPTSWRDTTQPATQPAKPVQGDLGRPWRPYAATAFIRCELGDHIKPAGWSIWQSAPTNHLTARYYEYQCTGPGSVTTVKGDVHDIGKNIVGVVLQCNGYEIIDLGVMTPCEKILDTAKKEGADAIGLSGLITPSLDEMVFVASEMERLGFTLPLLIGGATTSRTHTAVKIAPAYKGPTIYVTDASRAVPVVQKLLSASDRETLVAQTKTDQALAREQYLQGQDKRPRLPLAKARERAPKLEFAPVKPSFLGVREFKEFPLETLVAYIDWTPFFASWELIGRYPAILEDDIVGEAARNLYKDARAMLDQLVAEKWISANGVAGFWPANRCGDDIVLYKSETRKTERARLFTLRQQMDKGAGENKANFALADFVAPHPSKEGGAPDYAGGFAVTAGIGEEALAIRFKRANDDYSGIMVKALCDRLAEAFAECLHRMVRRELWGYAADETLSHEDLIGEKYLGIRPAPGYPAQPDHTEKATLFTLLDATARTGIELTESLAMTPGSSVSGLYLAHPRAEYFGVGRIDRDQVEDYARRKGWTVAIAERWLSPILAYDPAQALKVAG